MRARDSQAEFRRFLEQQDLRLDSLTPGSAFEAATSFYREARAEDCDVHSHGDALLFQWGTYDWGNGPRFEFDITRQFIPFAAEDDDDIWQLHLTLRFEPEDALLALGAGNRWCSSPAALDEFSRFVHSTAVFRYLATWQGGTATLDYECAG